jgi:hypothetical protein
MSNELNELISALHDGTMTLDDVAQRFRGRIWPRTRGREPRTDLEMSTRALEDPDPYVPGSFDDVTAAYDRGQISSAQYRVLSEAAAASINAEARSRSADQPDNG